MVKIVESAIKIVTRNKRKWLRRLNQKVMEVGTAHGSSGAGRVTASGYPPQVKGIWKYLYRAVDKEGKTIDFLLTAKRDKAAAMRFFEKAIHDNGMPEKVTMDKSGANQSAIDQIIEDKAISVIVRQVKYLNNMVEQDHRAVKRITKPMLGVKSFCAAKNVLAGIELMHMIRKEQLMFDGSESMSLAEQFYALAG